MNNGKSLLAKRFFVLLLIAATAQVWAGDDTVCEMPNPFLPQPVFTESKGASWRHGFHKMRKTWDKYFEVYPDELVGFAATTFDKVRTNPVFYVDKKIQFDLYYAKSGSYYRPFTPFNKDGYTNFNAWDYGTELWTKEGRASIHPFFYVEKTRIKLIQKIDRLHKYTPIHVWGQVHSAMEGLPWLEIEAAEIIPEAALNAATLGHIELGVIQLGKKHYDLAAQALEAALQLELPVVAEVKVYGMLGRAYYEQRLYAQARNALVNAILRESGDIGGLILLARTDLRIDKAAEARQAAEQAVSAAPANAEARAELGLALALLGDIPAGLKELDYALKLAPRNQLAEAFRNQAVIAMLENKPELAETELSKALLLRAMDPNLHLELGDVYLVRTKLDKACLEYQQAQELAGQRPEPYYKLALALKLQADALAKENKQEAAAKLYNEALKNARTAIDKDIHCLEAFGLEVEILRALHKESDAKKSLEKGVKANPKNTLLLDALYELAAADNDSEAMEEATRATLALNPTAAGYSRLGHILAGRPAPDFNAAAQAYQEAVRLAPDSAGDCAALGRLLAAGLGDWAGAETALAQAVKLRPDDGAAWLNLAAARRNLANISGALAAADEAVRLANSTPARILAAQVRLDRRNEGDPQAALELAQAAAKDASAESEKALAQSVSASALLHAGQVAEALSAFAAVDSALQENTEHNLWYGAALLKIGNLKAAKEHLQTALNLSAKAQSPLEKRLANSARKALDKLAKTKEKPAAQPETETVKPPEKPEPAADQAQAPVKRLPPVIEDSEPEPVSVKAPGAH